MLKLKLAYKGSVRKFQLQDANCFANVKALVSNITHDEFTPALRYLDEDEDWITISTEADLLLCFQTMKIPKIHIIDPNEKQICTEEPEQRDIEPMFELASGRSAAMEIDYNDSKSDSPELKFIRKSSVGKDCFRWDNSVLPVDWNVLVGDFLRNQKQALLKLVNDVYKGVEEGKDMKTLVMNGIMESSFNDHPFIRMASTDLEKMLEKVNHMSMLLLKAGKNGLEMAVPLLLHGYANMKAGVNKGVVDLAPVFTRIFPQMSSRLKSALADGQEVTFDLESVLRYMAEKQNTFEQPWAKDSLDESSPAASGIVIHIGVRCDICNAKPIIGVRYKCMTCLNFDMCEFCRRGNHPTEHPLISLQTPVPRGGFRLEGGHLKGANEFFKPKWRQDKNSEKLSKYAVDNNEKPVELKGGIQMSDSGFRAREKRRGRHGLWSHYRAGPPFGRRRRKHLPHAHRLAHVQIFDDSSSSLTSSSSENEFQNSSSKGSRKKLKYSLRKLRKKERKVRRKIDKLVKSQSVINLSLCRLQRKERHVMTKIAKLTGKPGNSIDETPMLPPSNNPGHDPNPNTRPFPHPHWRPYGLQRSSQKPVFPPTYATDTVKFHSDPKLNNGSIGHQHMRSCTNQRLLLAQSFPQEAAPNKNGPSGQSRRDGQLPGSGRASPVNYKYSAQLQILVDMGFFDIAKCKLLLDKNNGNVSKVIEEISSVGNRSSSGLCFV